ncbi:MAG: hypothetical protein R3F56_07515 [Planctomycetota bacterium]
MPARGWYDAKFVGVPSKPFLPYGNDCWLDFDLADSWATIDVWCQSSGTTHTGTLPIPVGLDGLELILQSMLGDFSGGGNQAFSSALMAPAVVEITGLPAGRQFVLRSVIVASVPGVYPAMRLFANDGRVLLEDVDVHTPTIVPGSLAYACTFASCREAVFNRCVVYGFPAMIVIGSTVAFTSSQMTGGDNCGSIRCVAEGYGLLATSDHGASGAAPSGGSRSQTRPPATSSTGADRAVSFPKFGRKAGFTVRPRGRAAFLRGAARGPRCLSATRHAVAEPLPAFPGASVMRTTTVAVAVFVLAPALASQNPRLFLDVLPEQSSDPRAFVTLGAWCYFSAETEAGRELWRTDGSRALMVRDINPNGSAYVDELRVAGTTLFFTASNGAIGQELWKQGSSGVQLIKDIWPGADSGATMHGSTVLPGGLLLFNGNDGVHGLDPWISDGTSSGTRMLMDFPESFVFYEFTADPVTGLAYFAANDGIHGRELWATDGTNAGTRMVADINASGDSGPGIFYQSDVPGHVLFAANDGVHGRELWVTDGTASGTRMVSDINLNGSSSPYGATRIISAPVPTVLFAADDGTSGVELWVTSIATGHTAPFIDLLPGGDSSRPTWLTELSGRVLFTADDGVHGRELWITDGSISGTQLVADINPGVNRSDPEELVEFGGFVAFTADDGVHGRELWMTDGTAAGTRMVVDLDPNGDGVRGTGEPGYAPPRHSRFVRLGNDLLFAASDGAVGREPWKTNLTAAGTAMIANLAGNPSSNVDLMADGDGPFWLAARNDQISQAEALWYVDPTTLRAFDIPAGEPAYICPLRPLDGTIQDPLLAETDSTGWTGLRQAAGQFFTIRQVPGSPDPRNLSLVHGWIYFWADDGLHGVEPWRTDGQTASLFSDMIPGVSTGLPLGPDRNFTELFNTGGRFVFAARDGTTNGDGLFVSDGVAGVFQLTDGGASITPFGNGVLFTHGTAATGPEPWFSDGTVAGTRMIADLVPGSRGSEPGWFADLQNGEAVFRAWDDAHGYELWKTDGTAAGTVLVKDIDPGSRFGIPNSGEPRLMTPAGHGRALFRASDGVAGHGVELWITDGTDVGTRRVADITGATAVDPAMTCYGARPRFFQSKNQFYFSAVTSAEGRELWVYDAGATAWKEGTGCGPSTPFPELAATNPVGGQTQILLSTHVPVGWYGATFVGVPSKPFLPYGNDCWLYFDLADFWATIDVWFQSSGTTHTGTLPIPAGLDGLELILQNMLGDFSGSGNQAFSSAVHMVIGT